MAKKSFFILFNHGKAPEFSREPFGQKVKTSIRWDRNTDFLSLAQRDDLSFVPHFAETA